MSERVFHLRNIKQVGRDERFLNSEKYSLIYYLQPFQSSLCSVLKQREKKPFCMSERDCLNVEFAAPCRVKLNALRYCHCVFIRSFNIHFDTCVLASLKGGTRNKPSRRLENVKN